MTPARTAAHMCKLRAPASAAITSFAYSSSLKTAHMLFLYVPLAIGRMTT